MAAVETEVGRGAVKRVANGAFAFVRSHANRLLIPWMRRRVMPSSVLHVSYMVHVPYYTVQFLRRHGYRADYLAVGRSRTWDKADYCFDRTRWKWLSPLVEFWLFWHVMAKYQTVHLHFMMTLSAEGWEVPVLKALNRNIVVHFRGCEARERELNMRLHPAVNICQSCDYDPWVCTLPVNQRRRALAREYGDLTLVTTLDLKDFVTDAIHFPFFALAEDLVPARTEPKWPQRERLRLIHWTNHPGIEGTAEIQRAVANLRARGYAIDLVILSGVSHEQVLAECVNADLAIGKMKMGYYANAQIESLCCGVPTITSVRAEFLTEDILSSGLIVATLDQVERVIAYYMDHPGKLAEKAAIARSSVLRLHDNEALTRRLIAFYEGLGTVKSSTTSARSLPRRSAVAGPV